MNDLTTANCNELSVGCRATLQEVGRGPVAVDREKFDLLVVVSRCSVVVERARCVVCVGQQRWRVLSRQTALGKISGSLPLSKDGILV